MPATSTGTEIVSVPPGIDISSIVHSFLNLVSGGDGNSIIETISFWWSIYSVFAILVSLALFVGFIYAKMLMGQLSAIESDAILQGERQWASRHSTKESKNTKWDAIQLRVTENSPESWRIAIIEADIMLDETLTNAGYVGKSIGEKLKTANPHSFTTVQDAWTAHKVRNDIAHVGSDFILTKKVAQDTLIQFERVFREFGVI
jgi:hypothetical protein